MPADTCGARRAALVCDRPPHADGDHRGYDEEHDAVLFWPTSEKKIGALADAIVVLGDITPQDVYREGFPNLTPRAFVAFYKRANGGRRDQIVTRIQFEYL